jgi:2-isopropylmalate synthase
MEARLVVSDKRVYLYDSTLRDGAQTRGVDFSAGDKIILASEFDRFGIDYVEGGWPGANPTDDAFFAHPPALSHATLTAFGMTRRPGRSTDNDPGLQAILGAGVSAVCMVGKTWDFHVRTALETTAEENLTMIAESARAVVTGGLELLFDAEHFFDGYKADPGYALACAEAAAQAGARWIVLCDTNGGTLPDEIERIVAEVSKTISGEKLGIHCHNDTGHALANSLAAVRAGARQVQGTFNGLGERCGNADLTSVIPNLMLKMGFETGVSDEELERLTRVSRLVDELLNRAPDRHAPYVGESAFAHKGGLHVSAVAKDPRSYEHIDPALLGNERQMVISDQAGRANVLARLSEAGFPVPPPEEKLTRLVEQIKAREFEGFSYDGSEASFELLAHRELDQVPEYFRLDSFRVLDERRTNAKGDLITLSEATIKVSVGDDRTMTVAEGTGPVNALDNALRKALSNAYPALAAMRLVDYKVRILTPKEGSGARIRVLIESTDEKGERWSTVGVSANVIDASYNALHDAITYMLHRAGIPAQ